MKWDWSRAIPRKKLKKIDGPKTTPIAPTPQPPAITGTPANSPFSYILPANWQGVTSNNWSMTWSSILPDYDYATVSVDEMYTHMLDDYIRWLIRPEHNWPQRRAFYVPVDPFQDWGATTYPFDYYLVSAPSFETRYIPDLPDSLLLRAAQWHETGDESYGAWLENFEKLPLGGRDDIRHEIAKIRISNKPKKPYRNVAGLPGYSENGAPAEWDTAMGTVRGFRTWTILDNGNLRGHYSAEWSTPNGVPRSSVRQQPDGRYKAHCAAGGEHESPDDNSCGCGFWAYWDDIALRTNAQVIGCVEGSGRLVIGERGFRAQYVRLLGLYVNDPFTHEPPVLNDYGVPVTHSFKGLAAEDWIETMGKDPNYAPLPGRYPELWQYDIETLITYDLLLAAVYSYSIWNDTLFEELRLVRRIIQEKQKRGQ